MNRILTPLETRDLDQLTGRGAELWMKILRWFLFAVIAGRFFVFVEEVWWYRIGWHSMVLGGWLCFVLIPYGLYQLVSRRISDGTYNVEKTLPLSEGHLIFSKIKTLFVYVMSFAGPLFLVGLVCDPRLGFTYSFLSTAYFQPSEYWLPGEAVGLWPLLVLAVGQYFGLWILVVSGLFVMSIRKAYVAPMFGVMIFMLILIFLVLARIDLAYYDYWENGRKTTDGGYFGLMLILGIIPLALGWQLLRWQVRR